DARDYMTRISDISTWWSVGGLDERAGERAGERVIRSPSRSASDGLTSPSSEGSRLALARPLSH
ncbi:MAG: hypothetical protein ACXWD8_17885, partial [Mycobacterium sp.]